MSILSIILDAIVLILFLINVYFGFKNGFIKSLLQALTTILSLGIAVLFKSTLSPVLYESFFKGKVVTKISDSLEAIVDTGTDKIPFEKLFEDEPEALKKILSSLGVSLDEIKEHFASSIEQGSDTLKADLTEYIAEPFARFLSDISAYLILFLGALLVLSIVSAIIQFVFELPELKKFNQFVGGIIGILSGSLVVWGISTGLAYLIPVVSKLYPDKIPSDTIENTYIISFLSNPELISLISDTAKEWIQKNKV